MGPIDYCELGNRMMIQQRYDEALEAFTVCLKLSPEQPSSYRNFAEYWLRRGDKLTEALKWAMQAVERERAQPPDSNLAEALATLAWAIAVNGGDEWEVNDVVSQALELAGTGSAETAAMVHCQAGFAYAALEDAAKSEAHFEEAARVDPQGRWGREARSMTAGVR